MSMEEQMAAMKAGSSRVADRVRRAFLELSPLPRAALLGEFHDPIRNSRSSSRIESFPLLVALSWRFQDLTEPQRDCKICSLTGDRCRLEGLVNVSRGAAGGTIYELRLG
jgi:hypothetical protein